ncbi:hypothetical protein H6F90_08150 [Trichocoleus sp. FACHB-591]|uniref:hypothetical protein n=1 Tax=Trichocoleus sp. FACHB-591 TaxID=2692872 RepID=UPI00168873DC|nr:hypothetical protein [Trichocoleus sp. FACHB-591]MBD2095125.1 hypothetical protein [Trichocoleus sp. FACHB-591]
MVTIQELAARIVDAGYGLLNNTDNLVIFGSAQEEATALPSDEPEISYADDFSWELGTDSRLILPANPNRLQATFVNHSETENVYLSYGGIARSGRGIALLKGGGTYEINKFNPYRGAIAAISTGASTLVGMEAV